MNEKASPPRGNKWLWFIGPGLLDSVVQYPTFLASGIRIRALHVQVAKRVLFESKGIGIQEDVAACKASIRFAVCGLDSGTSRELQMIVVVGLGSMHMKCQAPEACWVAWGARNCLALKTQYYLDFITIGNVLGCNWRERGGRHLIPKLQLPCNFAQASFGDIKVINVLCGAPLFCVFEYLGKDQMPELKACYISADLPMPKNLLQSSAILSPYPV